MHFIEQSSSGQSPALNAHRGGAVILENKGLVPLLGAVLLHCFFVPFLAIQRKL